MQARHDHLEARVIKLRRELRHGIANLIGIERASLARGNPGKLRPGIRLDARMHAP